MSKDVFIYRVDGTDTIISISDNWSAFASENAWSGPVCPEDVVGHKLWDFIQDIETQHLYRELFKRVRTGTPSRTIPFRCDSPGERRHLTLLIKALPNGHVEITSTISRTEARDPISLLDPSTPRSSEMVTVCSMCKKMKVSAEEWADLEEGLLQLKLFEADKMPQLSHGLCPSCHQVAMDDLNDFRASKKSGQRKASKDSTRR